MITFCSILLETLEQWKSVCQVCEISDAETLMMTLTCVGIDEPERASKQSSYDKGCKGDAHHCRSVQYVRVSYEKRINVVCQTQIIIKVNEH